LYIEKAVSLKGREKYLKSAWGKRYIKTRLRRYLTGKGREHNDDLYARAESSGVGGEEPLD